MAAFWRGEVSPRWLGVRVANLPPGAATWRALGVDAAWSSEAHLLANVLDALRGANWQRGGGKGPAPKPVERPAEQAERAAAAERHADRARRFLSRHRASREAS